MPPARPVRHTRAARPAASPTSPRSASTAARASRPARAARSRPRDDADWRARAQAPHLRHRPRAQSREGSADLPIPEFDELGYNYRLSDIAGRRSCSSQLDRLPTCWRARRRTRRPVRRAARAISSQVDAPVALDDRDAPVAVLRRHARPGDRSGRSRASTARTGRAVQLRNVRLAPAADLRLDRGLPGVGGPVPPGTSPSLCTRT